MISQRNFHLGETSEGEKSPEEAILHQNPPDCYLFLFISQFKLIQGHLIGKVI